MLHDKLSASDASNAANNSRFILRIEDTDSDRSKDEYTEQLCRDLADLGIEWDLGPDADPAQEAKRSPAQKAEYTQSLRGDIYDKYYAQLQESGLAYKCFCSAATLKMTRQRQIANGEPPRYSNTCRYLTEDECNKKFAAGEESVLRFKVADDAEIKFTDKVKGEQKFLGKNLGDFIIRKSTGTPSFMFSNAVDDALMGVDLVVRGDDHLSNTPNQLMILQALGLAIPNYAHISLITGNDGAPLSKRNGSLSIRELLLDIENRGGIAIDGSQQEQNSIDQHLQGSCLPDAIVNTLARLGCSYTDEKLLSMEELVKQFDTSKLSRSPARYDNQQLRHWQSIAMHSVLEEIIDGGELSTPASKYANEIKQYVDAKLREESGLGKLKLDTIQFIRTIKDNAWSLDDIDAWYGLIILANNPTTNLGVDGADRQFYLQVAQVIKNSPDGSIDQLRDAWKDLVKAIQQATGKKGKELFLPLRMLLTGVDNGPPLDELYALLGKESTLSNINKCTKLSD